MKKYICLSIIILIVTSCSRPTSDDLFEAISINDYEKVEKLINKGVSLSEVNENILPIDAAVISGDNRITLLLISKYQDCNIIARNSLELLQSYNNIDIIKALLKKGLLPNRSGLNNTSLTTWIFKNEHMELFSSLLQMYSTEQIIDRNFLLQLSINIDQINKVEYLINEGADINIANYDNRPPLSTALFKGNLEILYYLLNGNIRHIDLNYKKPNLWQEIAFCWKDGYLDIAQRVFDLGLELNDESEALHQAFRYGRLEYAEWLLEKGLNVEFLDSVDASPYHYAYRYGYNGTDDEKELSIKMMDLIKKYK